MSTVFENTPTRADDYSQVARQPLEAERCALLVADIQEKLLPPIFQKDQLVRNAKLLIRAAGILKIACHRQHAICEGFGRHGPKKLLPCSPGNRRRSTRTFSPVSAAMFSARC